MGKKTTAIILFALAVLMLLAACQRSASQAPVKAPTETSLPLVQTATGLGQLEMIGTTQMIQTMTAVANQGTGLTPIAPQTTPVATSVLNTTPGTFTLVPPTGMPTTPNPGSTPVVIIAPPTPGRPASYTLMQGEFPYCIARRFNVNQSELLTLNGLTPSTASNLQPNTVLQIPQTGSPFEGQRARNTHPTTYTVSSGNETVYSVACYFGDVDPASIIAVNGLASPYTLHLNQTLSIP